MGTETFTWPCPRCGDKRVAELGGNWYLCIPNRVCVEIDFCPYCGERLFGSDNGRGVIEAAQAALRGKGKE